jgi:hypothetical protein
MCFATAASLTSSISCLPNNHAHANRVQLEQDHATELQKLQDSVTATLNKHRDHRKRVVAENEYLRATVQCVL